MINELKIGEIGEEYILNKLRCSSEIKTIIDVRDNEIYREKDIDFILFDKNNRIIFLECKTDTKIHSTRNIAYEVYSSYEFVNGEEKYTLGCFEKTKSDYIIYCGLYKNKVDEIFVFDTKKLQEYYNDNKEKYIIRPTGVDKAHSVLIPLGFITGNKIGYKYKN